MEILWIWILPVIWKFSLKYDELLIQEYDGDKIRVNVANDAKNDVVVKETSGKITITIPAVEM